MSTNVDARFTVSGVTDERLAEVLRLYADYAYGRKSGPEYLEALMTALQVPAQRTPTEVAHSFWFELHPRNVQSEAGWRANAPEWIDAMHTALGR